MKRPTPKLSGPTSKSFAWLNQKLIQPHPSIKDIDDAKNLVNDFDDFNLTKVVVCDRTVYRRAASEGLSVIEYEPKNEKAIQEINLLYSEIYG